ncbi:MAG: hypothetical protein ABUL53_08220 [Bradyrhizobium guangdongense]
MPSRCYVCVQGANGTDQLAVNLRTAKALDIAVPASALALADEVIE